MSVRMFMDKMKELKEKGIMSPETYEELKKWSEQRGYLTYIYAQDVIVDVLEKKGTPYEEVSTMKIPHIQITCDGLAHVIKYESSDYKKLLYVVYFCYRIDIDDYAVDHYYFTKEPSLEVLLEASNIEKFLWELKMRRTEKFVCWECGREVNKITDIYTSKGIIEQIENWRDKYCGC